MGQHDLHLDTEDTLTHHNVTHSGLDVVLLGLTSLDHVAIGELLGLGTLATDLAGHGDLSTLSAGLHDEAEDTVAGTANSQTTKELVLKGLSLGLSVEAAGSDALDEELDGIGLEVESVVQ